MHHPPALCPLGAFLQLCSQANLLGFSVWWTQETSSSYSTPTNLNLKKGLGALSVSQDTVRSSHYLSWTTNPFPPTGCREGRKTSSLAHLSVVTRDLPVFDAPQPVILQMPPRQCPVVCYRLTNAPGNLYFSGKETEAETFRQVRETEKQRAEGRKKWKKR